MNKCLFEILQTSVDLDLLKVGELRFRYVSDSELLLTFNNSSTNQIQIISDENLKMSMDGITSNVLEVTNAMITMPAGDYIVSIKNKYVFKGIVSRASYFPLHDLKYGATPLNIVLFNAQGDVSSIKGLTFSQLVLLGKNVYGKVPPITVHGNMSFSDTVWIDVQNIQGNYTLIDAGYTLGGDLSTAPATAYYFNASITTISDNRNIFTWRNHRTTGLRIAVIGVFDSTINNFLQDMASSTITQKQFDIPVHNMIELSTYPTTEITFSDWDTLKSKGYTKIIIDGIKYV